MSQRKLGVLALGGIVLLLVGGVVYWMSLRTPAEPEQQVAGSSLTEIRSLREVGAFGQAYRQAVIALEQDPAQPDVALEAGQLALMLHKPEQAREHMQQAWHLGVRKLPVVLVIVGAFDGSLEEQIEVFEWMFAELEQTPAHLNAKARFYSRVGRHEDALLIWRALYDANPNEGLVLQISRKLEMLGRRGEALDFLQRQAAEDRLTAEGINLLTSLLVFDNQFDTAGQLIASVDIDDTHGEWALKQAMFLLTQGQLIEAEKALEALKTSRSEHSVALAVAHEARICLSLLRAVRYGTDATMDDLKAIVDQELQHMPARVVRTPLLGLEASPKQVEAERILYLFLEQSLSGDKDAAAGYARVAALLGDSPAVNWIGIRHLVTNGRAEDALSLYANLESIHPLARVEGQGGFFYKSPFFLMEAARAFYLSESPREALVLLSHLHQRGLYSPNSILLFSQVIRDTGAKADLGAMEQVLGQQFRQDVDFQLFNISQAVAQGEGERALQLMTPLVEANATNEDLKMVELMLLLSQGKTALVQQRLEASGLPERNQSLISARMALREGNLDDAEEYFLKTVDGKDFYGYLDYARFLVEQGRTEEASSRYQEILQQEPENIIALQGQAIIHELNGDPESAIRELKTILNRTPEDAYTLTRLAKLYLQTDKLSDALIEVSKVLTRDPGNVDAAYLEVTAMIRFALNQPMDVLRQRKLEEAQQRLRELEQQLPGAQQFYLSLHLAAAFRDTGESPKAAQIYREMLAMDASTWQNTTVKRQDVQFALKALND